MTDNIKSVLFVCTGNSCRSPMAEGLLKKYLKELGKDYIEVRSAGVGTMDDLAPTDSTIEVMKRTGIDVSGYRSKRLTDDLIRRADLILVMEEAHRVEVIRRVPEAKSKTYLIKEFGIGDRTYDPEGISIPDPIGRPVKDYERCLEMIKIQIERIAEIL